MCHTRAGYQFVGSSFMRFALAVIDAYCRSPIRPLMSSSFTSVSSQKTVGLSGMHAPGRLVQSSYLSNRVLTVRYVTKIPEALLSP